MSSYSTDPIIRTGFITALRTLANFLERTPGVPVPIVGTSITLNAPSTDRGGRAEVDHIAALLGATVADATSRGGHYKAVRGFGPLAYEVIAIPDLAMARYDAYASYYGRVWPHTP